MKTINHTRGFALVELIVYIAVFSIFIYITTSIFTSVLDIQVESNTTSVVQQDARFITERLTYDIRRTDSITLPTTSGESSPTLTLVIDGETITYASSSENLAITDSAGTANLNSNETTITNVSFLRIGNPGGKHSIVIDFTVESIAARNSGPEIINIHTTITTR